VDQKSFPLRSGGGRSDAGSRERRTADLEETTKIRERLFNGTDVRLRITQQRAPRGLALHSLPVDAQARPTELPHFDEGR
jgi:hypothetical protein